MKKVLKSNNPKNIIDRVFGRHVQSFIVLIIFLSVLISIIYLVSNGYGNDKISTLLIGLLSTIFGYFLGKGI